MNLHTVDATGVATNLLREGACGRTVTLALAVVVFVGAFSVPDAAFAQPDPRQMSGIPLPDPQLPTGTITVRVIRGQLANNVSDHPVELRQGDNVVTVDTDADGRAQFLTLNAGATVVAATELDGVFIDSQPFAVPAQGGIRLMLVGAGDVSDSPAIPAESGTVSFGADSRIVVELGEETLSVFYLFDIVNSRGVPVETETAMMLELPTGAISTTVLRESSPQTRSEGRRVTLAGPFAPGTTPLRIAYVMPYSGDGVTITQPLPVDLEALLLIIEKRGTMEVASQQIARRADMNPDGPESGTYIFAAGPPIVAGHSLSFEVSGLPHHSRLPGLLALAAAFIILTVGVWAGAVTPDMEADAARRRRLETRRERGFDELIKLHQQHQAAKIGAVKYENRRKELLTKLERVYDELDDGRVSTVLSTRHPVPDSALLNDQSSTVG